MDTARPPKILIVGVDGGTFSLIVPWVEAGELPNFARLMNGGAWGNLDSTIPPITPPAWTSFMTGKNPGKHGLYHFISPRFGTYEFVYSNANTRKSRTIWRILSDSGIKVGVVNVPMTFPPEKIDGFMISGLDTPDEKSQFIYPISVRDELDKQFGGVRLEARHLEFMRSDEKRDAVLKQMAGLEDHRTQLATYLIRNFPVDVFMLVFCSVDQIQHYFWHYMDTGHYRYDSGGAQRYGDAILKAYRKIDEKVGELLEAVSKDTITILMSDHGAGPSSDTVVHLNQYLSEIGVLQFKESRRGSLVDAVVRRLDVFLRRTLTPKQKAKVASLLPAIRNRWEQRLVSLSSIDWSKTKAFAYEVLPTYTNVWVNLKGRFPQGVIDPGDEYGQLIDFLMERLYELKDPETEKRIVKKIYKKDEVYTGPCSGMAPDLLISWWEDDGLSVRPSLPVPGGKAVRRLGKGLDKLINWTGTHRSRGIFLLHGSPFKNVHIPDGTNIVDLAPTLLYLLGCPIPNDMDGNFIKAGFKEAYLESHPITYCDVSGSISEEKNEVETYSEEEAGMVKQRLRALGYME